MSQLAAQQKVARGEPRVAVLFEIFKEPIPDVRIFVSQMKGVGEDSADPSQDSVKMDVGGLIF